MHHTVIPICLIHAILCEGKEHWLGLNNIHDLTQSKKYQLRVTMRNFDQQERVAFYDTFYLKDRVNPRIKII